MKKYIVEGIGTFTLTLVVCLSMLSSFPAATPVLAAITLMFFVYTVGHISGAHLNPAVSLAMALVGKISKRETARYISAQIIGALLALMIYAPLLVSPISGMGDIVPMRDTPEVFSAELLGAFFLAFGVASVVFGKIRDMSGVVVGTALFLGIALSVMIGSNGLLNPAIAISLLVGTMENANTDAVTHMLNFTYIMGPLIGAFLGAKVYKILDKDE